ncbi:uncharacterized protein BT62DRAFT_1014124 [Guyanagaster necrorhizus]|uniref:Uncharacterized protein n=1 Tax=Guyanagaster necrorhizus TaxID=856835 RepID=A0A9P8AL67_9AGAR|nr:uncharacterized protein BT62DRAFT_1014124 [Guyanagaster necrorhizus MCA 3950]KAG7439311.1 hypothetical protein BT62DRAFT_1014124 [Guyanagaster necrorhizus MCA 3950]
MRFNPLLRRSGTNWWSQVWMTEVQKRGRTVSLGSIVLKIFQPPLLPSPYLGDQRYVTVECPNPRRLARIENLAYTELGSLQGSVIPYYYGLHKASFDHY